jgi:molybdopterin adenylyltransferase
MNPNPPGETPSHEAHRAEGPARVRCAVITLSDTRTEADDKSGAFIRNALTQAGHEVGLYRIVKDEPAQLRAALDAAADDGAIRVVLTNGGTGITQRDTTYETLTGLFDKRMDGFGEIFRMLSYEEIGPAAMLSRAVAGTYRNMIVMAMPGSTNAVRLGMEKLIVPELGHLVREVLK